MASWLRAEIDNWVDGNDSRRPRRPHSGTTRAWRLGARRGGARDLRRGRPSRHRRQGPGLRPAALLEILEAHKYRGRRRWPRRRQLLRQPDRLVAGDGGGNALHGRRSDGCLPPVPLFYGAASVWRPCRLARLHHKPVRVEHSPARPDLRRRAARTDRIGAATPLDDTAARKATIEDRRRQAGIRESSTVRRPAGRISESGGCTNLLLWSPDVSPQMPDGAHLSRGDARTGLRPLRLGRQRHVAQLQRRTSPRHAPALRRGQPDNPSQRRRSARRQREPRRVRRPALVQLLRPHGRPQHGARHRPARALGGESGRACRTTWRSTTAASAHRLLARPPPR